jgi:hypothetical protein
MGVSFIDQHGVELQQNMPNNIPLSFKKLDLAFFSRV